MFYRGFIEVDSEKIEKLFDRIDKAREEIYDCYSELEQIGIVKIKREPANEDGGQRGINLNHF